MPGEGEAAYRRVPRSGLLPLPRVRITALADHEYREDILCASCNRFHAADVYIHGAGSCSRVDFCPAGGATFASTHGTDYDAAALATINARTRHVADDVARSHSPGFGAFATTDDARTTAGHD